jgi:hypothetical protein
MEWPLLPATYTKGYYLSIEAGERDSEQAKSRDVSYTHHLSFQAYFSPFSYTHKGEIFSLGICKYAHTINNMLIFCLRDIFPTLINLEFLNNIQPLPSGLDMVLPDLS